jgi:hypothetical protein
MFLVYSPDVTYSPAPDLGLSPSQLAARARQQLDTVIGARDPSLLPAARAVFNDALLVRRIPHPSLRAGLAMLVGTFAESLVDVYRAPFLRGAVFRPPGAPGAYAEVRSYRDGTQEVWFNPLFQHELPGQFATTFAHEALHAGRALLGENGRPEEATLHLIDTLVQAVMVKDQPELAFARTRAAVDSSTDVLGIVFNSLSMTAGRGPELFPGADHPDVNSFYQDASSLRNVPDVPSPGEAQLAQVINALGLADVAADPTLDVNGDGTPDFTRSLVERLELDRILDAGQVLSESELRQVASTLTVALPVSPAAGPPPTASAGGNRDTVVPSTSTTSTTSTTRVSPAAASVSPTPSVSPTTTSVDRIGTGAISDGGLVSTGNDLTPAAAAVVQPQALMSRTGDSAARKTRLTVALVVLGVAFALGSRALLLSRRAARTSSPRSEPRTG